MNVLSVRYWHAPGVEIGTVSDNVPDTGPIDMREGLRWEYQTLRDERLFEAGHFADFRKRWQDALAAERLVFKARMDAL